MAAYRNVSNQQYQSGMAAYQHGISGIKRHGMAAAIWQLTSRSRRHSSVAAIMAMPQRRASKAASPASALSPVTCHVAVRPTTHDA